METLTTRKVPAYGTHTRISASYMPNISVESVVFGFHDGGLKVLLTKLKTTEKWILPGGFVKMDEDVEHTARRVLYKRTGLKEVYMKQFYLFGHKDRANLEDNAKILEGIENVSEDSRKWYMDRFLSLSYYSLVEYGKVHLVAGEKEEVQWFDLTELPVLHSDHDEIIDTAIKTLRMHLGFVPIGYELLPEKFTMPELRCIYETILGRPIDRRNFQRKMLSIGLIKPLNETRKVGAHKSPNLYSFIKKKYDYAREHNIQLMSNCF